MSSRGLLSLALILVGVGCERFAYYGARAFLMMDLRSGGEPIASYAATTATMQWVGILCSFVGAGLAFGVGPRATAAVGALIGMIGCFVLAAGSYKAGGFILSAGAGILRPCPAAAAAEVLGHEDGDAAPSPRRFAAVTAFMLFLYGAVNIGALIAPVLGGALRMDGTSTVAYIADGVVALIGTGATATAAVLGFTRASQAAAPPPTDVYRTPGFAPQTQPAPTGHALVGLAILGAANIFYNAGLNLTFGSFRFDFPSWVHSVNPIVVSIVVIVLGCIWIAATQQRWSTPPLLFYGLGLAVFGFGLLVIGIAAGSLGGHVLGEVIAAAGEGAAGTVGTVYAALAVRNRASTFVVAGWIAVGTMASMFSGPLMGMQGGGVTIVFGFILGAAGIGFAALGKKIHRDFFERPLTA